MLANSTSFAALIDGSISVDPDEYMWSTEKPNDKWGTREYSNYYGEYNDGSGRDPWDINYLGISIENDQFKFGIKGGSIITGQNSYAGQNYYLSDLAINVFQTGDSKNPTEDSSGWDYAIRLMDIDKEGSASFNLYALNDDNGNQVGKWAPTGADYGTPHSWSTTETFKMEGGKLLANDIKGVYSENGADNNILEGSFDLSLLSLFDQKTGGNVISYLTMSCTNDEAIVYSDVSPVPIPASAWLFGSALLGFVGMSRRRKV